MKNLFIVLGLTIVNIVSAQNIDFNATIPVDPSVRKGKLSNGLVYYIKQNHLPEKRLELRLAINAGSMQENESQLGLAHFTEHMCFNGTNRFPKNKLVDFLQKMGIEFGAELNAYTSFDQTVYMLSVPSDRRGLIDTAVMVLYEWSQNVSFDNSEIDKERGVVISEWRLGLGAQDRIWKQAWPVLFQGSRYAVRMPIGKKETLETFPYDTLKQFYKDWYRPDLMALSIVGDVQVDTIENLIQKWFTKAVNPPNARPRIEFPIPDNDKPLVKVATDKEYPYSIIQVYHKLPIMEQKTIGDYKHNIYTALFNGMLNARFEELMRKPDVPFTYAGSEYSDFIGRTKDCYSSMAMAKENKLKESLTELVKVNSQVKEFGFTVSELEREKKSILAYYEKMANEKDKTESKSLCEEYIRNFLSNEPIPGIENEFAYAKAMLPQITVDELNSLARQWITDNNVVILAMLPDNEKVQKPTEQELLKVYEDAKHIRTEKFVDSFVEKPLVESVPKQSKVVSKKVDAKLGITEVVLENGATVVFKPNDWKNDEILFLALSPGGQSMCDDKDIVAARIASDVTNTSGLGAFDEVNLQKKMAGKTVSMHDFISFENEGIRGSASPKDLQTMMQMTYLYFTGIRVDDDAFKTYIEGKINDLKFQKLNPKAIYMDSLFKLLYNRNKRYVMLDTNDYMSVNQSQVLSFTKQRFSNAGDFTFFFVGNFKIDSVLPLVQKWIGGITSLQTKEKPRYLQPAYPDGLSSLSVKKGIEDQSSVFIQYTNPLVWDRKELLALDYLVEILNIKLTETVREEQSKVYNINAKQTTYKNPKPLCALRIQFGCAPMFVDSIINSVEKTMLKIANNGPEKIDYEKVKETKIRHAELSSKKNSTWLAQLESQYSDGFPAESFDETIARIKQITVDDIKQAAIKYFNTKNKIKAVLLPEK